MTSDYKKYSLEQLENWIHDALSCDETSPHEIYSTIRNVVQEQHNYHKEHSQKCFGLLELLSGHRPVKLDKEQDGGFEIDTTLDDCMPSDLEYGIHHKEHLTCDKDDSSPECVKHWDEFWEDNSRYTDKELDAMCDKAASDHLPPQKEKNYPSWVKGNQLARVKTYQEMLDDGWSMTDDGFWIKED